MKRFLIAIISGVITLLSVLPALAQDPIGIAATVSCDNISVQATSRYPIVATAMVRVTLSDGTPIFEGGTFTVFPNNTSSARFDYPVLPAKTSLKYFVDVVSDAGIVTKQGAGADCISYDAPKLNGADFPPPIAVYCTSNGSVNLVRVEKGAGVESRIVTAAQIAQGLLTAQQTGQNAQITSTTSGMGLWALTSSELQATLRGFVNYDFIFPITYCGGINTASLAPNFLPSNTVAQQPISPIFVVPSVQVGGTCTPVSGARFAHVVASGQNLFRIGLSYGVPFQAIAAFNGINASVIYTGQCIQIP